ncbi:uncharacterized protein LOC133162710 [Syngnathus typhle]|uniref:uncharacterized protein LOC133162710 n=1 Tax=Syngnathus typhle TaxID=161592 RepID=UPI002A6A948C|nr:uncharacterized protein LOC133162710 [Syngnathus typhle]
MNLVDRAQSVLPVGWVKVGRTKRSLNWKGDSDPTYIDAIGVPRGVPSEYKLVDQIAAGWESSICWWCTVNKNVDRINYIHYNVQKLGNWTQAGLEAVHEQLATTSLTAFQNRIALDMLLSEKGGVCAMFGEQCYTFIPNNTAPDGSLTRAIAGLQSLNARMKEHSGVDTSVWDKWMDVFGKYKALVSSILISVAVFAAILTLCGCCCVPCLRALFNRLITTAISPMEDKMARMYLMSERQDDDDDDDVGGEAQGQLVSRGSGLQRASAVLSVKRSNIHQKNGRHGRASRVGRQPGPDAPALDPLQPPRTPLSTLKDTASRFGDCCRERGCQPSKNRLCIPGVTDRPRPCGLAPHNIIS